MKLYQIPVPPHDPDFNRPASLARGSLLTLTLSSSSSSLSWSWLPNCTRAMPSANPTAIAFLPIEHKGPTLPANKLLLIG